MINRFKNIYPDIDFCGVGGIRMRQSGFNSIFNAEALSVMGFTDVIKKIPFFINIKKSISNALLSFKPDLFIPIDFPGLNLKLAEIAKKNNIKVLYFISPQVWAWRESRIPKIGELSDKLCVIFDFEVELYRKYGFRTEFVGHPLLDIIKFSMSREEVYINENIPFDKEYIAILPGSRISELKNVANEIGKAIEIINNSYKDKYQFLVIKAPNIEDITINNFFQRSNFKIAKSPAYDVIKYAKLALVTSGTATMETAIIGTPMIVMYKTSFLNYLIAKKTIKVPFIAMPNIIFGKKVLPELIQNDLNSRNLIEHIELFLNNNNYFNSIKKELSSIKKFLGPRGAINKTVSIALELIGN